MSAHVSARTGEHTGGRSGARSSPSAGGVPFTGESGRRPRRGTTERPRDVRPAPEGELEGNEK
ncbi:hypothetical protein PYK79_40040 [Streptomyces sp. ID05-04B]|uniref:hypothetical protein n=1 Tax=unclassified Streptomyces TaxID=2593676 RepID=UPI000D1A7687|nr:MULTISPECIES: hypothetical protein [unclassified Streptomyces]AVV43369.1 hypothetical protein C6376_19950 [Streptomyces sp. P3]MDX5568272.1 hypothetical protein [Streptomyces sp. ID05-04B]